MAAVTKELLNTELQKIGWKIVGIDDANMWIYDHENKKSKFRVLNSRIELLDPSFDNVSTWFDFEGCQLTTTQSTVTLGTGHCFAQFININLI